MNKLSIVVNVILALAVGILFFLHFSGKNCEGSHLAVKDTIAGGISIAYVNTDTLWERYEKVKILKAELEKTRNRLESELTGKAKSIEKEVYSFQEKIQAGTVSQDQAQAKEQELMQKQQALYQLKGEYEQKALEEETKKNEDLRKEIYAYIQQYNRTHDKYSLILAYATGGAIMVGDSSLEITPEILKGINEEFAKKKAK
jgi:outer membrane protein